MAGILMVLFVFLFGLCVGSFLNVVVYRLNTPLRHRLHLFGRSFCDHCKHKLAWKDNIPIVSFILLRGKCRYCHSPISWQYPLVELATGVLTILVVFHLAGVEVVASPLPRWLNGLLGGVFFYLLITYVLIAIFVSDLKYGTIPDEIVYPAMGLTIVFQLLGSLPECSLLRGVLLWDPLLAGLGAAAFFLALVLITKGRGMGMGDVNLAGLMGLALGWPKILVAIWLAFLTGAAVGVILILIGKKKFGEHIPFGPFLAGATFVSLFWGEMIWNQGVAFLLLS